MPWTEITQFLSRRKSLGPEERPRGQFVHYQESNMDIVFLVSLFRKYPSLSDAACVPNVTLNVYQHAKKSAVVVAVSKQHSVSLLRKGYYLCYSGRAGIMLSGIQTNPVLTLPRLEIGRAHV